MPSPPNTAPAAPVATHHHESFLRRIFGFLVWVGTGFGLFAHLVRGKSCSEEIRVYSVHQSFFLWALVLIGFIGAPFVRHFPSTAVFWGWIYVWVLLYTLVTVLFDVSTTKILLWLGIFSFAWLVGRYLEDLKHIAILTPLLAYFHSLSPRLDPGTATVVSWILLPVWLGSLFETFSWGRKTFTPNSIEEWFLGEGSEVTDRSGLKFRTQYRDIFETILGMGAGDLEAINASGQVVKRWPNILFLVFLWKNLDGILHQRTSLVENPKQEPVEVEEVNTRPKS